jgi:hypothetical protein
MARPLTADNLVAALEAWGIPYVETSGWRTRENQGGWGSVEGFLFHHTGDDAPDANDLKLVTNGRVGLSGPLCNQGLADDGTVYLVAAGAANHAGGGDAAVLRAMAAGDLTPPPSRYSHAQLGDYPDAIIGNPRFNGVEAFYYAVNNPAQRKMMTKLAACWIWAMNKQNGTSWGASRAIGHREWQRGKIDPRVFGDDSLGKMRAEVAAYLKAGPTGDDVEPQDLVKYPLGVNPGDGKTPVDLGYSIEIARNYSFNTYRELVAMRAQIAALVGAVAAVSGGEEFDEQKLLDSIGERVRAETAQAIVDAGAAVKAVAQ